MVLARPESLHGGTQRSTHPPQASCRRTFKNTACRLTIWRWMNTLLPRSRFPVASLLRMRRELPVRHNSLADDMSYQLPVSVFTANHHFKEHSRTHLTSERSTTIASPSSSIMPHVSWVQSGRQFCLNRRAKSMDVCGGGSAHRLIWATEPGHKALEAASPLLQRRISARSSSRSNRAGLGETKDWIGSARSCTLRVQVAGLPHKTRAQSCFSLVA
jgi:hypothetical protein